MPSESSRRKPGAGGTPVRLANGERWLLAQPVYACETSGLTHPRIDEPLDQVFERIALGDEIPLSMAWSVARALLLENYHLADAELTGLLTVAEAGEARGLVDAVLALGFGEADAPKGYCDWVRASLLANGLSGASIPARDLTNVLSILVATHRTVPLPRFADACRVARERSNLEAVL